MALAPAKPAEGASSPSRGGATTPSTEAGSPVREESVAAVVATEDERVSQAVVPQALRSGDMEAWTPQASPGWTPQASPGSQYLWPRTMSGDDLLAEAGLKLVDQPVPWPRTMSGDDLEDVVGLRPAAYMGGMPTAAPHASHAQPSASPGQRPIASWPRTMSGDDLSMLTGFSGPLMGTPYSDYDESPNLSLLSPYDESPPLPGMQFAYDESLGLVGRGPLLAPPVRQAPEWLPASVPPPPMAAADRDAEVQVLRLASVLLMPELGSPERPTEGSTNHRTNNCKPCAFLHTKGCFNGAQCPFCHLCEPGEKKRRQKERKDALRFTGREGPR